MMPKTKLVLCPYCNGETATMWVSAKVRWHRCAACSSTVTDDNKPVGPFIVGDDGETLDD